jgi:hypothetical protein
MNHLDGIGNGPYLCVRFLKSIGNGIKDEECFSVYLATKIEIILLVVKCLLIFAAVF